MGLVLEKSPGTQLALGFQLSTTAKCLEGNRFLTCEVSKDGEALGGRPNVVNSQRSKWSQVTLKGLYFIKKGHTSTSGPSALPSNVKIPREKELQPVFHRHRTSGQLSLPRRRGRASQPVQSGETSGQVGGATFSRHSAGGFWLTPLLGSRVPWA